MCDQILFQCLLLVYLILGSQCCPHVGTEFLLIMPQVKSPGSKLIHTITVLGKPRTSVKMKPSWTDQDIEQIIDQDSTTSFTVTDTESQLNLHNYDVRHGVVSIVSSDPVVLYVHVNKGDGYTGLPRPEVGIRQEYITTAYRVDTNCEAYIGVTAYDDNSIVDVVVRVANDGKAFHGNDERFDLDMYENMTLNRGEILLIRSNDDLTGSVVTSVSTISVFAGVTCKTIPEDGPNTQAVIDQSVPVSLLVENILSVPVNGRSDETIFRQITTKESMNMTDHSGNEKTYTDTGDFNEFELRPPDFSHITGTSAVLVYQYLKSDVLDDTTWPVMNLQLPEKHYDLSYSLVALQGFNTKLFIIHPFVTSGVYTLIINDTPADISSVDDTGNGYVTIILPVAEGSYSVKSGNLTAKIVIYVYSYGPTSAVSFVAACAHFPHPVTETSSLAISSSMDLAASPDQNWVTQDDERISTISPPTIGSSFTQPQSNINAELTPHGLSLSVLFTDVSMETSLHETWIDHSSESESSERQNFMEESAGFQKMTTHLEEMTSTVVSLFPSYDVASGVASLSSTEVLFESGTVSYVQSSKRLTCSVLQDAYTIPLSSQYELSGAPPTLSEVLSDASSRLEMSRAAFRDISKSQSHDMISSTFVSYFISQVLSSNSAESGTILAVQNTLSSFNTEFTSQHPSLKSIHPGTSLTSAIAMSSTNVDQQSLRATTVDNHNLLSSTVGTSDTASLLTTTKASSLTTPLPIVVAHTPALSSITKGLFTSVHSTVTLEQETTRSFPILCTCPGTHKYGQNSRDFQSKLINTKLELTVNAALLSSNRRRHISAANQSLITKFIGAGSFLLFLLPLLVIIFMDMKNVYGAYRKT